MTRTTARSPRESPAMSIRFPASSCSPRPSWRRAENVAAPGAAIARIGLRDLTVERIDAMPGIAPFHTGEHDLLLGYVAQQRSVLHLTAYGLTDEQART